MTALLEIVFMFTLCTRECSVFLLEHANRAIILLKLVMFTLHNAFLWIHLKNLFSYLCTQVANSMLSLEQFECILGLIAAKRQYSFTLIPMEFTLGLKNHRAFTGGIYR